jgi:hypothetical protein
MLMFESLTPSAHEKARLLLRLPGCSKRIDSGETLILHYLAVGLAICGR